MDKELFNQLLVSAKQARDIVKGKIKASRRFIYQSKDISNIRRKLHLSQEGIASLLRIPTATFRNWEQGRTLPDAPAQTLLQIVAKKPEALYDLGDKQVVFSKRACKKRTIHKKS